MSISDLIPPCHSTHPSQQPHLIFFSLNGIRYNIHYVCRSTFIAIIVNYVSRFRFVSVGNMYFFFFFRLSISRHWCLLPFVPLSRHLPPSIPPHPSPKISLVFLSLFLLVLISLVFGVFLFICPYHCVNT